MTKLQIDPRSSPDRKDWMDSPSCVSSLQADE
jgi:hypothetical protein